MNSLVTASAPGIINSTDPPASSIALIYRSDRLGEPDVPDVIQINGLWAFFIFYFYLSFLRRQEFSNWFSILTGTKSGCRIKSGMTTKIHLYIDTNYA